MINANEPAFPVTEHDSCGNPMRENYGLSKREHFAAMAMQGMISNGYDSGDTRSIADWRDHLAHDAVRYADALLRALRSADAGEGSDSRDSKGGAV